MKKISADELAVILKDKIDFVLELGILQESKLCFKPVYRFLEAFAGDLNIPEFCLVYSEADDPEEIFIAVNSKIFDEIFKKYDTGTIIFYGEGEHELCESFYYDKKIKKYIDTDLNFKLLTKDDKNLKNLFNKDADFYLKKIFCDFVENKLYYDCGIIGAHDKHNNFTGYLAYYEIAENIRDISYIYIGEKFRGLGYGRDLLNFFVNKNTEENKISYYSCAENDISKNLAKSCGFIACAKRKELKETEADI